MSAPMKAGSRAMRCAVALLAVLVHLLPAHASDDAPTLAALSFPPGQMPLGKFDEHGGENLYRAICQACHMPDGRGAQGAGAYPALAANPRLATGAYAATRVLAGRGAMPALANSLSDEQVADVVNYVRSHFDNHYADTITTLDVAGLRASLASPPVSAEPHAEPIARP